MVMVGSLCKKMQYAVCKVTKTNANGIIILAITCVFPQFVIMNYEFNIVNFTS